jgi:hypothetical protein
VKDAGIKHSVAWVSASSKELNSRKLANPFIQVDFPTPVSPNNRMVMSDEFLSGCLSLASMTSLSKI